MNRNSLRKINNFLGKNFLFLKLFFFSLSRHSVSDRNTQLSFTLVYTYYSHNIDEVLLWEGPFIILKSQGASCSSPPKNAFHFVCIVISNENNERSSQITGYENC